MPTSVRRLLLALSALILVVAVSPSRAQARGPSCSFCENYCPSGELAIGMCWRMCGENSSDASCSDPYDVCGSQTLVNCNGEREE